MMRVNSKGRPYAKDLFDIYSALLIQQPLTDHRSLFRTYPSTFTTDEAVESLGNLEFTHLVSTPNPLDASNPILTRTTTTFSMSRAMAKTLGQHFINARLTENATDPQNRTMKDRGIWSPTPKGKCMIQDFSRRARVPIKHMQSHLARIQTFPIVQFERLLDDDQISFSRQNMIEAFKTMMEWLPTDTILFDDVAGKLVGSNENVTQYKDAFYGYQCFEWISEYTSVVSSQESEMIAAEFVQYGWMLQILDKSDKLSKSVIGAQKPLPAPASDDMRVACSSESMLQIDNDSCDFGFSSASSTTSSAATTVPLAAASTLDEHGTEDAQNLQERLDQLRLHNRSDSGTALYASSDHHCQQHQPNSQHARLESILEDPLVRMYFRHFLKSCFCEENINFWVDYTALIKKLGYVSEDKDTIKPEEILSLPSKLCDSLLVHCCSIYNNYFCPENAPSELNIDHGLRYDIVQYMQATFTSTVYSSDEENANSKAVTCLYKILHLYDQANNHICRIMAQDSVPRFMKTQRYKELMQSYYLSPEERQKKLSMHDEDVVEEDEEEDTSEEE
ncbi:hypothetical protein MUCCIDRAFT_42170 [Mucor lusitanicus CBS 277.49]|uniref:RGS domain-containing protein n=1 Tax=Mucor lusitanicus CBS 277.49 TaxID=747725 RepID=A0A168I293_MUCCL|nr:hypothetical protein MUCCIDRAFT_42170 [Mucor lusitanicus CBS 277.49]